ncbi:MAG: DUF1194 domain-containing protein [Roseovarius sp.]
MKRALRRLVCAAALAALGATAAGATCRQALALGLDVSGSVDAREYRLQADGLAAALLDPQVQAAFLAYPGAPVRLMIFEWSSLTHQRELSGWKEIHSAEDLGEIATRLRATRPAIVENPSTAIGAAMLYGAVALNAQSECWQKTLDISGDGPANIGRHPRDITEAEMQGITVNGLVIGPDSASNTTKNRENMKSLLGYYRSYVLRGANAFTETAVTFEDFETAMRRKLIRELEPAAVSRLERLGRDAQ